MTNSEALQDLILISQSNRGPLVQAKIGEIANHFGVSEDDLREALEYAAHLAEK